MTSYEETLWTNVREAIAFHKKHYVDEVSEFLPALRGKDKNWARWMGREANDAMTLNLCFSVLRSYVPMIYTQHPRVYVYASEPGFAVNEKIQGAFSAWLAQNLLDKYQKRLKMKQSEKLALFSSLIIGLGYTFNGWCFEAGAINPNEVKDNPFYRFVSGLDIIPDPHGLEFEDKRFIVRVLTMDKEQAANLKYRNLDMVEDQDYKDFNFCNSPFLTNRKGPVFFEVWDKPSKKVYVWSSTSVDGREPIKHKEYSWNTEAGFPATPLILNPMIDSYYPKALFEDILPLQRFASQILNLIVYHGKRALPKIISLKGALDAAARNKLNSGETLANVEVDLQAFKSLGINDVSKAVGTLPTSELSPSLFGAMQFVLNWVQQYAGVMDQKVMGSQEKSATEASIIDGYLKSRIGDYQNIVEDFIIDNRMKLLFNLKNNQVAKKWISAHILEIPEYFLKQPTFMEQVKQEGNRAFVKWNGDSLSNLYDLEVGFGSTLPMNDEFRMKKALQIHNVVGNDPFVNKTRERLWMLRELGFEQPENMFESPQPSAPVPPFKLNIGAKFEDLSDSVAKAILEAQGITVALPTEAPMATPIDQAQVNELNQTGVNTPPNVQEV